MRTMVRAGKVCLILYQMRVDGGWAGSMIRGVGYLFAWACVIDLGGRSDVSFL